MELKYSGTKIDIGLYTEASVEIKKMLESLAISFDGGDFKIGESKIGTISCDILRKISHSRQNFEMK